MQLVGFRLTHLYYVDLLIRITLVLWHPVFRVQGAVLRFAVPSRFAVPPAMMTQNGVTSVRYTWLFWYLALFYFVGH